LGFRHYGFVCAGPFSSALETRLMPADMMIEATLANRHYEFQVASLTLARVEGELCILKSNAAVRLGKNYLSPK
jgi:hypothetical protein